jgi:guanosine-3',5'-bis(diphosphate) 3'-pyrophosphohydrolase
VAALHDTIEDTETTAAELEELFGGEVSRLVSEVSDDKPLPGEERKRLQIKKAARYSDGVKLIRIADKISNLRDVTQYPPQGWSPERRRRYLEWAEKVVRQCRGVNGGLDALFDETLKEAREAFGEGG